MGDVWVSVLGPMRLRVDGVEVQIGGPRPRTVLALLLAAGGHVVSTTTLIEQLWPDRAPGKAENTLQGYVSLLRRLLEPGRSARSTARRVVWERTGYALYLPQGSVDVYQFERIAAEAHAALAAHRPGAAAAMLDTALSLWRGRPYEDVPEAPMLVTHAARLERIRAAAVVDRHAAAIALGEHAGAIAPLTALADESPLDERLWELLALAQYRAGRQGDALASLRTAQRHLAEELGVDPGERLRTLESQILAQSPGLGGPVTRVADETALPTGRLPMALDEFVGRRAELGTVAELIARHRLVTLVGAGGVGKTRLALEVAQSVRASSGGGPWLVELAPVRDAGLVAATIARALGLVGVDGVDLLTDVLRGWETLLVIDNCEHLVDATAEAVAALLRYCPGLRVLATSRQPLRVAGETIVQVEPLQLDDAVDLFMRRAQVFHPGTPAGEVDERLIRRICAVVDGLPLAVEIAAARSRVLPLDRLADGLTGRLGLLTGGKRGGPARHRSVTAALDWGYSLLEPTEKDLLRMVGGFAGGFTLDAAEAVAAAVNPDPGTQVLEGIGNLVDRSLVMRGPGDRYRLLETVRQFARHLQTPAERAAVQRAHLRWVLEITEEADRAMVAGGAAYWGSRLEQERDNIRAALAAAQSFGDAVSGLRIGSSLMWFWYRWGAISDGISLLRRFLDAAGAEVPAATLARARFALGGLNYLGGDVAQAHTLMTLAGETAAQAGDQVTQARCLGYAAHFAILLGTPPEQALAEANRGARLALATDLDWVRAEATASLGVVSGLAGDLDAAVSYLDTAWRTALRCGHEWVLYSASWALIKTERARGRARAAADLGAAVLTHLSRSGDQTTWLMVAHTTAGALAELADTGAASDIPAGSDPARDAARLLGAVDAMSAEIGFAPVRTDPLDAPAVRRAVAAALPAERFEAATRAGRSLSRDDISRILARYRL